MTTLSAVLAESQPLLEDTGYRSILEFARDPDSLDEAWKKVKQDINGVQFDGTNPQAKTLARMSTLANFIHNIVTGAASQGFTAS